MGSVSLINGHIDEGRQKTNFEDIKSMSINRLAKLLAEISCGRETTYQCFFEWLESEVDEDETNYF